MYLQGPGAQWHRREANKCRLARVAPWRIDWVILLSFELEVVPDNPYFTFAAASETHGAPIRQRAELGRVNFSRRAAMSSTATR